MTCQQSPTRISEALVVAPPRLLRSCVLGYTAISAPAVDLRHEHSSRCNSAAGGALILAGLTPAQKRGKVFPTSSQA